MKVIKLALLILVSVLSVSASLIFNGSSSEKKIAGTWKQLSWSYARLEAGVESVDGVKEEIHKNLIIHEAEQWVFNPDGKLLLSKDSYIKNDEELRWSVKGRGHIIELTHQDGRIEDYQIELLSEDLLVIYFSFDIQIRGLVKMTFSRL